MNGGQPQGSTFYANQPQKDNQQNRSQNYKKPNHISENIRQISTVGPDGSTIKVTAASTHHDGEEVHSKITQEIRLQRIGQLEASGTPATLGGSKRPSSLKLFITKLDPDTTPGIMENSLLHYFPSLEKVIARRHRMERNRYYCSFTVIVIAKKGYNIDIEAFISYNWPDDIRCFLPMERQERNV